MASLGGLHEYFGAMAASLPAPVGPYATSSDTTYRLVKTLTHAGGQKKVSSRLRHELAEATESVGLHTDLPLDDPTHRPGDKILFSKAPFAPPHLVPSNERSLRDWALSLVGRVGPFQRCYKPQVEFKIPGHKRYVDLLLHERGPAGTFAGFVVVEFEKTAPGGTVAQTLNYMRQLRETPIAADKHVRGVIVSAWDHLPERSLLTNIDDDLRWYVLEATLKELTA